MKAEYTAFDGKKFTSEGECYEYELCHYKTEYEEAYHNLLGITKKIDKLNSDFTDYMESIDEYDDEDYFDFDLSNHAKFYRLEIKSKSDIDILKKFISSYKSYFELYCDDDDNDKSFYLESNFKLNNIKQNNIYLIILDEKKNSYTECESARECIYNTYYTYKYTLYVISYDDLKKNYLRKFSEITKGIF